MIISPQNNQVKAWKKLKQRKYRKQKNSFIVEGFHLVEEACHSGWDIEVILAQENTALPMWVEERPVIILAENVFKEIAETKAPQGIAAIVKMKDKEMITDGPMLLMDAVQDPGNVGTMIRTADALGFTQVILGKGSADIYNEKVVRASQGSIFHLSIVEADLESCIPELQENGFMIWASTLEDATPLQEAAFTTNTALIVGNEGEGISHQVLEAADKKVKIPINGKAESFNVAIAAGIMMYEVVNS